MNDDSIWNLVEFGIWRNFRYSPTVRPAPRHLLTTHRSLPDHRKSTFCESNQPSHHRELSLPQAAVDRYKETSGPMSTHPHSAGPALHRVSRRVAANDNQVSVRVSRYRNRRRPNHTMDQQLCIRIRGARTHEKQKSDGSTICNCSSIAKGCSQHR